MNIISLTHHIYIMLLGMKKEWGGGVLSNLSISTCPSNGGGLDFDKKYGTHRYTTFDTLVTS